MKSLLDGSSAELLAAIASGSPAPAAGSAVALTAATAAALVCKVARLTLDKADHAPLPVRERYVPFRARAEQLAAEADRLRLALMDAVQEDAELVERWIQARQQPGDGVSSELALLAAEAPLRTAACALEVAEYAGELVEHGSRSAREDAATAGRLALAAAEAAMAIAAVNLTDPSLDPTRAGGLQRTCAELTARLNATRK